MGLPSTKEVQSHGFCLEEPAVPKSKDRLRAAPDSLPNLTGDRRIGNGVILGQQKRLGEDDPTGCATSFISAVIWLERISRNSPISIRQRYFRSRASEKLEY